MLMNARNVSKVFLMGVMLATGSCQQAPSVRSVSSGFNVPGPAIELGEQWTAEDAANSAKIVELMRQKMVKDYGSSTVMKRDAHPKHHGCVKASLSVNPQKLDSAHRVGLFANAGSYEALIRFSNGSPNPNKPDIQGDARGMAVKIMGVPYTSYLDEIGMEKNDQVHDLVFMNSEVFFNEASKNYVQMVKASMGGPLDLVWTALTNPYSVYILAKISGQKVYNPLDLDYHSAVPYKLGPVPMRMSFKTCKVEKDPKPKKPAANFLSERLATHLAKSSSCFDFYVQANRDLKKNPVEEPMSKWDHKKSPLVHVGRLEIPQQSGIHSAARQELCENITYNPWRAPVSNRPLGVVNRIRLDAYTLNSAFRLEHSGTQAPRPQHHSDIP